MKLAHLAPLLGLCILVLAWTCGCTSAPAGGGGIQDITTEPADDRIGLEEALRELEVLDGEGLEDLTGMEIVMVSGSDVDLTGNATTWTLGVRQAGNTSLLVHSRGGWSRYVWHGPLPDEPLDLDAAILPAPLYRQHAAEIRSLGEATDLTLVGTIYTVRSKETQTDSISFDALSGEATA
ncbi:hypothetical protein E2N92_08635 [Methanofollis formosanus]|uniref:Uncharacterized protein n=1 Tax=Methanofollis formosanus TaxID=299308 RepID=A0A8G1EH11_9EURY|nr:hypothetical protein [Methanofollis formosanus]QYZ79487.1 hypothetical protein E2N92_08635 [Methanofollis formosanus]